MKFRSPRGAIENGAWFETRRFGPPLTMTIIFAIQILSHPEEVA
jgi:hypothetical protein